MVTLYQIKNFIAAVTELRKELSDDVAIRYLDLYPSWEEKQSYIQNDRVVYDKKLYRVLENHISNLDLIPDKALHIFELISIQNENE